MCASGERPRWQCRGTVLPLFCTFFVFARYYRELTWVFMRPMGHSEQLVAHGGAVTFEYRPTSHSMHTPSDRYMPRPHGTVGSGLGTGLGASEVGSGVGGGVGTVVGAQVCVSGRVSQHAVPKSFCRIGPGWGGGLEVDAAAKAVVVRMGEVDTHPVFYVKLRRRTRRKRRDLGWDRVAEAVTAQVEPRAQQHKLPEL